MRWIFEDPAVRKIRHGLREGTQERRHAAAMKVAVGTVAATATFYAGVEVLGLGGLVWRIADLTLFSPLASAFALP